jgi:hypothetical protein
MKPQKYPTPAYKSHQGRITDEISDFPQLTSRIIGILEKLIVTQLHRKVHEDSQLLS